MSVKGYTTKVEYGDTADYASAVTWTEIAKAKNIKPPKITAKDIDTTHLNSPDEFEESIPGLASGGETELSVQYDKTATATLYGLFRTVKAFRLHYPDGSGWKLNGFITEIGDDEIVNGDIVMTSLKIKVTGKPVMAATLT